MRTILLLLAISAHLYADEPRTWTQRFSGKTMDAVLVAKNDDAGTVKLAVVKGKSVWVKLSDLSEDDAKFAAAWVEKPANYAPIKVVLVREINEGYKKVIRVRAMSRSDPLNLNIHHDKSSQNAKRLQLEPYSTEEMEIEVFRNFRVCLLNEAGEVLHEETTAEK